MYLVSLDLILDFCFGTNTSSRSREGCMGLREQSGEQDQRCRREVGN